MSIRNACYNLRQVLSVDGYFRDKNLYYTCCPEFYGWLEFNVTLQRRFIVSERGVERRPSEEWWMWKLYRGLAYIRYALSADNNLIL